MTKKNFLLFGKDGYALTFLNCNLTFLSHIGAWTVFPLDDYYLNSFISSILYIEFFSSLTSKIKV